jgi:hypothetical protein
MANPNYFLAFAKLRKSERTQALVLLQQMVSKQTK